MIMITQQWYMNRAGETYGPYPWEEIVSLCLSGTVSADDYLSDNTDAGWRKAADIPELAGYFPSASFPPTPPPPTFGATRSKAPFFIALGVLGLGIIAAAIIFIPQLLEGTEDPVSIDPEITDGDPPSTAPPPIPPSTTPNEENNLEIPVIEDDYISFEESGIIFSYPDSLASTARLEVIEETDDFTGLVPRHRSVRLYSYELAETFYGPEIMIFPLEDYKLASANAADTIAQVENFIAQKNAPDTTAYLPFLPEPMAGQLFSANGSYLESEKSGGIRYLTQYGQDIWPITNYSLFYTYQGITSDGLYYISATFPVNHPLLPADSDEYFDSTGLDYAAFDEGYIDYITQIAAMIDQADDDQFTPSLEILDELIKSLEVEAF